MKQYITALFKSLLIARMLAYVWSLEWEDTSTRDFPIDLDRRPLNSLTFTTRV